MTPETELPPESQAEVPTGEGLVSPPCSQYLPLSDIPPEVHEAAETLFVFFEQQGMRRWEFSHVADRRLVSELEGQRDAFKAELENIANASPSKWEMTPMDFQSEFLPWAQNRARRALSSANSAYSSTP